MIGLLSFFLLLLVLILITLASVKKKRGFFKLAAANIIFASILGWSEYILPSPSEALFFLGSFLTVAALSGFLYAVYSLDWVFEDVQEISIKE